MKKNFQKSTLPTQNGLVGAVSQAFANIGYTLTPLETKCLSFVGYLPGRPGRGSCKHSAYALVKEERVYAAIISTDTRNAWQPKLVSVQCSPLYLLDHMDLNANTFRRWEHRITYAFHSLGGTSFSHVQIPEMWQLTTDGTDDSGAMMIDGHIYLVYGSNAYKVIIPQ